MRSNNRPLGISIPLPCHESWHNMQPSAEGRHCNSCNKQVIDFTSMSNDGIERYIQNNGHPACGRFTAAQLQPVRPAKPIAVNSVMRRFAFCLIACFFLNAASAQVSYVTDTINGKEVLIPTINKQVEKEQRRLFEQKDYSISGTVLDESKKPLAGARIITTDKTTLVTTDDQGHYSIKMKYVDVKEFTNLTIVSEGKEPVLRNIHRSLFPTTMDIVMEPEHRCCNTGIIMGGIEPTNGRCCDIDIHFPADKLFEKPKARGKTAKGKKTAKK